MLWRVCAATDVLLMAVDVKCKSLTGTGLEDDALKRHPRSWMKLQGLVRAIALRRPGPSVDEIRRSEAPPSTRTGFLHWPTPGSLPDSFSTPTRTPGCGNSLLAQRVVPQHCTLRGHVSSKMADVFLC